MRTAVATAFWDNRSMNAPNVLETMQLLGLRARQASRAMARAGTAARNQALRELARLLRANVQALQAPNERDLARAREAGLAEPLVDRLKLTPKIIATCAEGCEQLAAMPDVIGDIVGLKQQPSGIRVGQMRVPIGVFGMIYESRPNVTIEAASLSIKSGNACILRGGSEAIESNKALAALVSQALESAGLPPEAVQLVPTTDRAAVGALITMPEFVDVIIPRGGKGLIERISAEAKVPVIKHLDGNCHTYVDDPCDIDMAVKVVDNAKTQKYSPCNATESLLVARGVAADFLPRIGAGGIRVPQQAERFRVAAHFHGLAREHGRQAPQEFGRDGARHQQAFGGVAGAVLLRLGVVGHLHGQVEVARVVHIGVAVAVQVLDHGHLGLGADALDQALAAARDDDVDELGHGDELAHGGAVGCGHQLHRLARQAGAFKRLLHQRGQRLVGVDGLAAAAQDAGVAALDAQ